MSELVNPNIIWFLIGLVFVLLEFMISGYIIIFFGIAAWLVSLLYWFVEISVDTQIFIFIISSLMLLSSLRKWLKKALDNKIKNDHSKKNIAKNAMGEEALAITTFEDGKGKIKYNGKNWKARSNQNIEKGSLVKIVDRNNITMIVKSIQNKEKNNE